MRLLVLTMFVFGCTFTEEESDEPKDNGPEDTGEAPGIGALGNETHDVGNITVTVVGTASDGLNLPRDLAFNPDVEDELWVVNRADDSATIYTDVGGEDQESTHIIDPFAYHFMEEVSSIAFGAAVYSGSDLPNFGTCQESVNSYNGMSEPNNFMGPSLWSSDPEIFGESNPEAVEFLTDYFGMYVDLGSHLDMLHQSPLCMGLAWERDNLYWVFNGQEGSIDRNDFQEDHGPGFDDHNDGIIGRYARGEFARVADVPSHMEFDPNTGFLYIADTGNNAIKVLDTTSGERGLSLPGDEPLVDYYLVDEAVVWTLIEGDDHGMEMPSGLAIVEDHLLVTDYASGKILAFDLEGELVDWVDTDVGDDALMGIVARSLDDIWVVDSRNEEILRIQP